MSMNHLNLPVTTRGAIRTISLIVFLTIVLLNTSFAQITLWNPLNGPPYLWSDPGNWSNGVPTASSIVTISGATVCTLDIDATIAALNLNNGNLDLNGHSLTINGNNVNSTFSGGTITNTGSTNTLFITTTGNGVTDIIGTVFGVNANVNANTVATTSVAISGSATFNGTVSVQSPNVFLSGATFNAVSTFTKTGGNSNISTGSNTFNADATINNQGAGDLSLGGNTIYNGATTITNSSTGTLYTHSINATGLDDIYNDDVAFQNLSSGSLVVSNDGPGQSVFTPTHTVAITNTSTGVIEISRSGISVFEGFTKVHNDANGIINLGSGAGNPLVYFLTDTEITNNADGEINISHDASAVVRFGFLTDNTTNSSGGTMKIRNNGSSVNCTIGDDGDVYFSNTALADIGNTGVGTLTIAGTATSQVVFDGVSSSSPVATGTLINNSSSGIIDIGALGGARTYFLRDVDIFNGSTGTVNISNEPGSITRFGYQTDDVTTSTGGIVRLRNIGPASDYRVGNIGNVYFSNTTNTTISNENSGRFAVGLHHSTSGTCIVDFNGVTTIKTTTGSTGNIFVSMNMGSNTASSSVTFNNAATFQNDGFGAIFVSYKLTNSPGSSNVTCNAASNFTPTSGAIFIAYLDPGANNANVIFNGAATFTSYYSRGIVVADQATASASFRGNVTLSSSYNPGGSGHSAIELGMNGGDIIIDGGNNQTMMHGSVTDYLSYVGSLTINKSAGLLTINSINTAQPVFEVTSNLTLTSGIVQPNRAINFAALHLGVGVTASSGNSAGYFAGPISKTFNNALSFVFHVGRSGTYRPLSANSVNASLADVSTFIAEYKKENWKVTQPTWSGSWPAGYVSISQCEYWWFDRSLGNASVNSLTLPWVSADCTGTYVGSGSTLSELKVTKWDGANWIDLGGTSYTGDYTAGSVTSSVGPITSFSPFTIGSTSSISPLPITLSSFNAKIVEEDVELSWITATEINSDSFEVERSSDGQKFSRIGSVAAAGNSNIPRKYHHTDAHPHFNKNYYRLKLLDFDGAFEYSPVIVAIFKDKSDLAFGVYPNPVEHGKLVITTNPLERLNIIDPVSLRVVRELPNVNSFPTDNLPPGVYLIQTADAFSTKCQRLVVY